MSFSRVQLQSSREHDRHVYHAASEYKPMGLRRVFFSALTILFGAFMYYVAMHYIPALANPRETVRLATETQTLPSSSSEFDIKEASALEKIMGSYYHLLTLDRSYMREGEAIKIKYEIPVGATVQLDIVQCQRIWVIEVFNCKIVSQFSTKKNTPRGIATYALGGTGFYHFRHKVEGLSETDSYRLVWERVRPKPEPTQTMVNENVKPT